jgi:hypothetical protein
MLDVAQNVPVSAVLATMLDGIGRVPNWCAGKPGRRRVLRRPGASRAGHRASDASESVSPMVHSQPLRLDRKPPSMRRRRTWSRRIDRLMDAAGRNPTAWRFPHPDFEAPLPMSTRVVWACRPDLLAIKEALQDHRQPISAAALRQLKTFLTDPARFSSVRHQPPGHKPGRPSAPAQLHRPPRTSGATAIGDAENIIGCWRSNRSSIDDSSHPHLRKEAWQPQTCRRSLPGG